MKGGGKDGKKPQPGYALREQDGLTVQLDEVKYSILDPYRNEFREKTPIESFVGDQLNWREKEKGYTPSNPGPKWEAAYEKKMNNYVAKKVLESNPKTNYDNRVKWLKSFAPAELKAIENSNSKGKIKENLLARLENYALGFNTSGANFKNPNTTEEEAKRDYANIGALISPLQIPANVVGAYVKGESVEDAVKGAPSNMGGAKTLLFDPFTYLVGTGGLTKVGKGSSKIAGKFFTPRSLGNNLGASVAKNLEDLKAAQKFAQQYGYSLPTNIERIAQSDMLTDKVIRGMMDRHNTFVRGVSTNWEELGKRNPEILRHLEGKGFDLSTKEGTKAAAEYMATHIPIATGYGRASLNTEVFDRGLQGLYTSNSIPTAEGYTYGQGFVVKTKKPTNFSSVNRQDWITQNNPYYRDEDKFRELLYPLSDETKYAIYSSKSKSWNPKSYDEKLLKNASPKQKAIKEVEYRIEQLKKDIAEIEPNKDKWLDAKEVLYSKKEAIKQMENDIKYLEQHGDEILKTPEEFKILRTERSNLPTDPYNFLIKKEGNAKKMSEWLKTQPYQQKMREVDDLGESLRKYTWEEQQPIRDKIDILKKEANEMYNKSVQDYMKLNHPDYDPINKYAHYIHLGTPGEKILQPIKSWEITPEIWKNKSRAHTNIYSKKFSAMSLGGLIGAAGSTVQNKAYGGIVDPRGQWAHPGKVTTIPGNNITMKGVNYPVLGISDTGDKKLMMPGRDYKFKGKSVTEYPIKMQKGGGLPGLTNVKELSKWRQARLSKLQNEDIVTNSPSYSADLGTAESGKGYSFQYLTNEKGNKVAETGIYAGRKKLSSNTYIPEDISIRDINKDLRKSYREKKRKDRLADSVEGLSTHKMNRLIKERDDFYADYVDTGKAAGFAPDDGYDAYHSYLEEKQSKSPMWYRLTHGVVPAVLAKQLMPDVRKMQKGGELPKYQYGRQLPTKYVSDPNDPSLKAYSDSLSLYTGSKKAYDLEIQEQLEDDSNDWLRLMTSPYLTAADRVGISMPSLDDYYKYGEGRNTGLVGSNFRITPFEDPRITDTVRVNSSNLVDETGFLDGTVGYAYEHRNSPIKPHSYRIGEGLAELYYKNPVQPVKLAKRYGQVDPQTERPIDNYVEFGITERGIKKPKPLPNNTKSKHPWFSIPSTLGVSGKDIYSYDEGLGRYNYTDTVTDEEAKNLYLTHKKSLDSMKSDLNKLGYKEQANPYTKKMQSGGKLPKFQTGGQTVPGAVKLPYETPEQQKARMQKYGLPMPTAADSLAVYNNAMRVNAFYTDPVRNYKPARVEDEHGVEYTPARQIDETLKEYSDLTNFKRLAEYRVSQANDVLKVDRDKYNSDPDYYEMSYGFKPNFDQALKSNRIFSDYQYSVQDRIPGLINPSAPGQYSDFRIRPTFTSNLGAERNLDTGGIDPGALTILYGYDPLDVKPWHMRTEKEKQYLRDRRAGITTSSTRPAITKFGQKDPLPTKGIPKLNVFGSNPDLKTPALKPMQNKLPAASKPVFSIPSTHSLNGAEMRDIYEWDETTQQYRMVDTVTPEVARSIYKAYAKSSLDSMKADLNTMGLNKGKGTRNPFIQ